MQGNSSMILPCRILLPLQLSFISHVARYAPSSRQLQEQNNTTIQYKLILNTYLIERYVVFSTTAKKLNNWCYTSFCGTNKKEDTLTDVLFFI